ncbi:hypothetical protein [Algoriphagus sp. NG3]|uniref:hypothetical protein n=1 Tax=Algoriphagus sp. NG3 TaxID=3097546 RepID=UPI002A7F723B|nr:hypothetical protein [Algoriphagus sp. NG3]WPR77660.1 hypothetical protein SLW71_09915 [Algoriphagus sp. NG3]
MKKSLAVVLIASCISCISDRGTTKTLTIHASSEIGGGTLFVLPSSNGVSTDSLTLELPQDTTQITYKWKPKLSEGSFVFGVVGREDVRDTAGYYTNGVLTPGSSEYVVPVYEDSLHLVEVFE